MMTCWQHACMATAGGFVIRDIRCEGECSPHQKLSDGCVDPSSLHGLQVALIVFQASPNLHSICGL